MFYSWLLCTFLLKVTCTKTAVWKLGAIMNEDKTSSRVDSTWLKNSHKDVFSGLICGLRTGAGMDCGGMNPESGTCPTGYNYNAWLISKTGTGVMKFCSKQGTNSNIGPVGAICGLNVGAGGQKCGDRDTWSQGCPDGYARYEWLVDWGSGRMAWCYKVQHGIEDQPGTICGMQTNGGDTGPTCNGYQPGRGSCPHGYYLVTWRVSFGNGYWSFCVKN
ncbi:unnamed protein product [Rotaria socialis]|uniref:Uncharacterized protein n=1 Tax=Rotaria socialis TaxID=392032 RepID=A0A820MT41_9BILA|nr:unnamed protein product [Rotaria socialis]CAF3438759.1 unnamed protein product [Rotaria socialis]CAF3483211.1 unnamed protein product [Rotaria socialis]CAF3672495.1 unnamed protein product [Rotaria socialis]CAF4225815.1 unnamed protein product [Rotaria socialis]